jgi:hypothetical protein
MFTKASQNSDISASCSENIVTVAFYVNVKSCRYFINRLALPCTFFKRHCFQLSPSKKHSMIREFWDTLYNHITYRTPRQISNRLTFMQTSPSSLIYCILIN